MSLSVVRGALIVLVLGFVLMACQTPSSGTYSAPRTPDGKADLNGIWQAFGTAYWDLQSHSARQGPVTALGAAFSIPAGLGVVEGDEIPYQPWAAEKKKENQANWLKEDPEIKCYLPGVPRSTYMPYPFQITQTPTDILMAFEFATAVRSIAMEKLGDAPVDSWMGQSAGRWDGDTLVVETNGMNGKPWLDRAGNFASENIKVVERFTRTGPDHLLYEATIEDPKVFTRPWKISMPLYRRVEKNAQLLEYKCVEFAEELLYGDLRKPTTK